MNSKEIAKLAGVSRSTVTRVINNYPDISDETRKKVMNIVEKHKYMPNSKARSLAGIKSKEIGLFIYLTVDVASSTYLGEFITYAVDTAENHGYSALVSLIRDGQYGKITNFLAKESIQGAIILGGAIQEKEVLELLDSRFTVVAVDMVDMDRGLISNKGIVNPDNFGGAYAATEFLLKNGHKNIIHIKLDRLPGIERYKGYIAALNDYGIEVKEYNIIADEMVIEGYNKVFLKYIEKYGIPDAIFAASDSEAISVIKILKKIGYSVPKDISVIGFDNIYISKEIDPPLTTMGVSPKLLAENAIENLINLIEGKGKGTVRETISVKLVERKSVLKK